jgi:hypothetical protein
MTTRVEGPDSARTALVLIPGSINYFYNLTGRRVAEALRELGFAVDVCTLATCPERNYDWCILVNISEVALSVGDEDAGLEQIRGLGQRCRVLASCSLDCVGTRWFEALYKACTATGVSAILDLGLVDQAAYLSPAERTLYHFVPSGLTDSERRQLDALETTDEDRPIPWAFIGHATAHRAALVDYLVRVVDPRGFVYMPALAPYTEKDSPYLNQQQFERVLRLTRYQFWCSHHHYFYMEPERFRMSLLTGSVPIKIVESRAGVPQSVPFRYLLIAEDDIPQWVGEGVFERVRRRFQHDFRQLPSLRDSLAAYLVQVGILRPEETAAPRRALAG